MALRRLRSTAPGTADRVDDAVAEEPVELAPGGPKGRPTPKRSEARAGRGSAALAPPANRKEAAARARSERRRKASGTQAALRSGDISRMPERDRAPERVLTRDVVDSRRTFGPVFLGVFILYFVASLAPSSGLRLAAVLLMLLAFVLEIADCVRLGTLSQRRVQARYPGSTVKVRLYAAHRAVLPRRMRLPRARVALGADVR